MKSNFRNFVLASAALAAAAFTTLPAMAATSATLNVPFNFTVNGRNLPAGEYMVVRDTPGNFVRLQAKNSNESYTWVASPTASRTNRVVLKFEPGADHVLQSIQYGPLVTADLSIKSKRSEDVTPRD